MAKRILKIVGYTVFFLVVVGVFMYWTFPMDKVRHFVERTALQRAKLDLRIGELELSGLSGVVGEDLVLRLKAEAEPAPEGGEETDKADKARPKADGEEPKAEDEEKADEEKPEKAKAKPKKKYHIIRVDRVEAHASLWQLLFDSKLDLAVEMEALGGRATEVHLSGGGKSKAWEVNLGKVEDINLALITPMEDWLGFPVGGTLGGSVKMTLASTLWNSRVDADITIEDALLRKPVVDVPGFGPIYLTDIDLGTLTLKLQLDRRDNIEALSRGGRKGRKDEARVFHVEELSFEGGDIELKIEPHGTVTLQKKQPLKAAQMNMVGSFRVDDAFFDKTIQTKSGVEKPNGMLRMVLKQDRKWKTAQRDGVYGFRCRGGLAMKSCTPTRPPKSVRYSPDARRKRAEKAAAEAERKKQEARERVKETDRTPRPTSPTRERARKPEGLTPSSPTPRMPTRTEKAEEPEEQDEGAEEPEEEAEEEADDEEEIGDDEELGDDEEAESDDEESDDEEGDEEGDEDEEEPEEEGEDEE